MSRVKFIVRLKSVHDKTGLTAYAVARKVNASENTVRKYVDSDNVVSSSIFGVVIELCNFYGVDWRDPNIVETLIENDEDEDEAEIKEALTA